MRPAPRPGTRGAADPERLRRTRALTAPGGDGSQPESGRRHRSHHVGRSPNPTQGVVPPGFNALPGTNPPGSEPQRVTIGVSRVTLNSSWFYDRGAASVRLVHLRPDVAWAPARIAPTRCSGGRTHVAAYPARRAHPPDPPLGGLAPQQGNPRATCSTSCAGPEAPCPGRFGQTTRGLRDGVRQTALRASNPIVACPLAWRHKPSRLRLFTPCRRWNRAASPQTPCATPPPRSAR